MYKAYKNKFPDLFWYYYFSSHLRQPNGYETNVIMFILAEAKLGKQKAMDRSQEDCASVLALPLCDLQNNHLCKP